MALTVAFIKSGKTTGGMERIVNVTFDDSYPTGGESLTARNCGLNVIEWVQANPVGGYIFEYDYTNKKLKAYMCDYSVSVDGPMIEVANEANLSTITARLLIKGY